MGGLFRSVTFAKPCLFSQLTYNWGHNSKRGCGTKHVRRLNFAALALTAAALAWLAFGRAAADPGDTIADVVFGLSGGEPTSVAVDAIGNVYIVDAPNSRVLEYDSPLTTDTVADRVFGQGGSFTTNNCNMVGYGGLSPNTLCTPYGVAVDADGNVYISDAGNNRLVEYDSPLTTDTVADRVILDCGCTVGLAVDSNGNLYVADEGRSRVLEYDSPLTTDTLPDRVFGQGGSFTTGVCNKGGMSASSLCNPGGVAVDRNGNLYVTETTNHRVLEYDSPLTTDTVADRIFGQGGSFTADYHCSGPAAISASSLCDPFGAAVDGNGNVYISDADWNRILEYDSPLTTDAVADRVFGQGGSFTIPAPGHDEGGLWVPHGLAVDMSDNVYVADAGNRRVLEYDAPLLTPSPPGGTSGAVGGIVELSISGSDSPQPGGTGSSPSVVPIALAGMVGVMLGGWWYARRRWLR